MRAVSSKKKFASQVSTVLPPIVLGSVASSRDFITPGCYLSFHSHLSLFTWGSASVVLLSDHRAAAGTAATNKE